MQEECYGRTEVQSDEDCRKAEKISDEDRLWHTLGVMQMSASLAIRYDYPIERAQLARLLHD